MQFAGALEEKSGANPVSHLVGSLHIGYHRKKSDVSKRTETKEEEDESSFAYQLSLEVSKISVGSIEDGRVTKAYFDRLKIIEYGAFAMSLIGIGLSIIQYELEFNETDYIWSYMMLWAVFISSMILALITLVKGKFSIEYGKTRKTILVDETLISTGRWKSLLIEILICLIGPSPFLIGQRVYFTTPYDKQIIYMHVNEILILFLFLRVLIIIRVLLLNSRFSSNRSQRICEMYSCQANHLFVIKCLMKEAPFLFLIISLMITIPCAAYLVRICENPFSRIPNQPFYYDSFLNCMWNVIVTITTVGYGDYFVRTILGRCVITLVCIWGIFIVSMMVVTLSNTLNMNDFETRAYSFFCKLCYKDDMRKDAASIITLLAKGRILSKKADNKVSYQELISKLRNTLKRFKSTTKIYKELANSKNIQEDIHIQFEFLRDGILDTEKKLNQLVKMNELLADHSGINKEKLQKYEVSNLDTDNWKKSKSKTKKNSLYIGNANNGDNTNVADHEGSNINLGSSLGV